MAVRFQELGIAAVVAVVSLSGLGQTTAPAEGNAAPTASAKRSRAKIHKKAAKAPEPAPAPVVEQQPPPPPRPYEMSPVAPEVTFNGGKLTIVAPNSTLADILTAVKSRTGTKIEFPPSATQERVAVQLGPGDPRDVLAQLLQGSPFDYILLGSDQDPTAVTQIILTRRQAGGTAVASGSQNPAPRQPEPADEDADTEPAEAQGSRPIIAPPGIGQPVPGQPPNQAVQPGGQPLGAPPPMQTAPDQNASPSNNAPAPAQGNQVKSPEQLLQELQQMQKREQQKQKPPQ